MKKRVLIANNHLKNQSGSEIHCLELAEFFIKLGFDVDVAAFKLGKPIINRFQNIGINLINLKEISSDIRYDIVWSHHKPVFYYLHFQLEIKSKYFIHQMLSPFMAIEYFPLFCDSIIDKRLLFFANSYETQVLASKQSGKTPVNILHNSIPDNYFEEHTETSVKTKISKICIISNHPPIELRVAMKLFKQDGIKTVFYGKKDVVEGITPSLLSGFDLVITIGKTVQYCFACSVPVYNYDHHGGGYISLSQLEKLEKFNFSGRYPGSLKSPKLIYKEIIDGYSKAVKDLPYLYNEASKRYRLDRQLLPIFKEFDFNSESKVLFNIDSVNEMKMELHYYLPKTKLGGLKFFLKRSKAFIKSFF